MAPKKNKSDKPLTKAKFERVLKRVTRPIAMRIDLLGKALLRQWRKRSAAYSRIA